MYKVYTVVVTTLSIKHYNNFQLLKFFKKEV